MNVGTVERIHPQLDESGVPNIGRAVYDVRIFSRRARPYVLTHLASRPRRCRLAAKFLYVLLAGEHARGGWITGTVQAPTPQMQAGTVGISAFGTYVVTGPSLPEPPLANRIVEVDDAFIVTSARMTLSFSLELPPAPGLARRGRNIWRQSHTHRCARRCNASVAEPTPGCFMAQSHWE